MLRMGRKSASITILAMVAVVLAVFTVQTLRAAAAPTLDEELSAIVACGKEKNSILCSRPIVKRLLETATPAEIMDALTIRFRPAQCHYVGHVVGQMAYVRTQNIETALSQCNRACDSACVHGAIGEVFMEKLGFGTPDDANQIDLAHLSDEEMREVGKQLCLDAEACHGVGHAVFQAKADMGKSMDFCNTIAPQAFASSCYNGAAMEYADILASRNMRDVSGIKLPDMEALTSVCTKLPNILQQRSCFRYYPRMVVEALEANGYTQEDAEAQILIICKSYKTSALQSACFSGVGSYNAYFILTDQDAAVKACQDIPGERNRAGCYFGEIAVGVEERQEKLIPYCSKLPDADLQYFCYQTVFFYLNKFSAPKDKALQMCGTDNKLCMRGYRDYRISPWDTIATTFSI